MFGLNPIVSQHLDPEGALKVVDMFYTLQGEGPYSGMTSVFVRLADCNLRCVMCDTDFTTGARVVDVETLVQQVRTLAGNKTRLVVITGGEPLLQNITPFCRLLAKYNFRVQIETAGTVWVPGLEGCDVAIVCSPKTGKVRNELQLKCINFKYVVGAGDEVHDGGIVAKYQAGSKPLLLAQPKRADATVWIQPRDDQNPEKNAANTAFARDLCLKYGYRMSVQLHKIVGVA
jgi:organic radical activating enzyme